ncbi:hypothetical protein GCM10023184_40070 [Flaviaesturariibacter amylovorans]|uniref:PKD domain-containing protein n=1 Tax=Flaviaesturariibacter amylovorans TaxID=1084520 RepID=A0ABP8HMU2_9BACT
MLSGCAREYSYESGPANRGPVADAGTDQALPAMTTATTLDGSASHDPDGTIASYTWVLLSGAGPVVASPTEPVSAIRNLSTGSWELELTVADNKGATAKDTVRITVGAAPAPTNRAPVARAGADTILPTGTTTATLNGSGSYDPDGTITAYRWDLLSAAGTPALTGATQPVAQASGLSAGTYLFRLTVTDNGGATGTDSILIRINNDCGVANRPIANAQLGTCAQLPAGIAGMDAVQVGNKLLFVGGEYYSGGISDHVMIYDLASNTSYATRLPVARLSPAVTVLGNKVFVAGGHDGWGFSTARVDIYDVPSNTWSAAQLSVSRTHASAVTVGNKVLIAGGQTEGGNFPGLTTVDIYDGGTNSWRTAQLAQPRTHIQGVALNGKAYFTGGMSQGAAGSVLPVIEVYDAATDSWSQPAALQMTQPRVYHAAFASGNTLYLAGGFVSATGPGTNQVEMIDVTTGARSFACLATERSNFRIVQKGTQLVFFTGTPHGTHDTFDILHLQTLQWTVGKLSNPLYVASIIGANNEIYVAGGAGLFSQTYFSDKVSKLTW